MDFSHHQSHEVESIRITDVGGVVTFHDQPMSKLQLSIKFSCQRMLRLEYYGGLVGSQIQLEGISSRVYIQPEEFSSYNKTREIIDRTLRTWQLCYCRRECVIEQVIRETRRITRSVSPKYTQLLIDVEVKVIYCRNIVDESRMLNDILQRSIEENNDYSMIPATDSSIKSLKRKKLDDESNNYDSCSICLDKFYKGTMTAFMPCSHMFHNNCITKWLKTSHYCPVCRFEMPIDA